jgi:hypothetical protein
LICILRAAMRLHSRRAEAAHRCAEEPRLDAVQLAIVVNSGRPGSLARRSTGLQPPSTQASCDVEMAMRVIDTWSST